MVCFETKVMELSEIETVFDEGNNHLFRFDKRLKWEVQILIIGVVMFSLYGEFNEFQ